MGNPPPYDPGQPPSQPDPAPPPGDSWQQPWAAPSGPLPPRPTAPPQAGPSGTVTAVLLALLGGWTLLLAGLGQLVAWLVDQLAQPGEATASPAPWIAVLVLGPLAGVPALLMWRLGRHPLGRPVARAWTCAAAAVTLLVPVRLLAAGSSLLSSAILAVALAVFGVVLSRLPAFRVSSGSGNGGSLVALATGLLVVVPWWYFGALGGITDTVAAALLAAALGWFAAVLLAPVWRDFADRWSQVPMALLGGLVGMVTVAVLVAGATPRASTVFLTLLVPLTGFVCAAVSYAAPKRLPTAAGIAAAAFGPLAFFDPDELDAAVVLSGPPLEAAKALGFGVLAAVVSAGLTVALAAFLRRRAVAAVVVAVALVVCGGGYALAGQHGFTGDRLFVVLKPQADLTGARSGGNIDARRQAVYDQLVAHAKRSQQSLRDSLDAIGVAYRPYYLVNAIEVDAGAELRPWLSSRDEVAKVLDSPQLRPVRGKPSAPSGASRPAEGSDWNLNMVRAGEVAEEFGVTGKGVVVGQSDTGVDGRHPELRGNYRGRAGGDDYNWYDPWFGSSAPTDRGGGHGTHTLATAVGAQVGVAPGAQWFGCTNLGRNFGNPGVYLDCLQFLLAPFPRGGDPFADGDPSKAADVLNNSWGCPRMEGCDPNALRPAVRALTAAGVFVVASAGNTGPSCGTVEDPMAIYDDAFSVAAVTDRREVAPFSSRGPVRVGGNPSDKPDLAAPGENVWSAVPGGRYTQMSGTSMAGPHVAGAVALMWSANPELKGDVAETARLLRASAQEALPGDADGACGSAKNLVGAGILDTFAAVKAAERVS